MPATGTFLSFAYGSNMLTQRIRGRCPSATALGVAELKGYELRWHKRSQDGSGKCDVVETDKAGAVVYGVLYLIAASEESGLDNAEGLGSGYEKKRVTVRCDGRLHAVSAYYATAIDGALRPFTWYKALVIAGAEEHGLPAGYVARLEAAAAVKDPNRERHANQMALLNGATEVGR